MSQRRTTHEKGRLWAPRLPGGVRHAWDPHESGEYESLCGMVISESTRVPIDATDTCEICVKRGISEVMDFVLIPRQRRGRSWP